MQYLTEEIETLFKILITRGKEQGVVTEESFHDLAEEVIEERVAHGEIDPDEDTEGLERELALRWMDYRDAIGLDSTHPLVS